MWNASVCVAELARYYVFIPESHNKHTRYILIHAYRNGNTRWLNSNLNNYIVAIKHSPSAQMNSWCGSCDFPAEKCLILACILRGKLHRA